MNRTYHKRFKTVHGFRVQDHPFYDVWSNMLSRCFCKNDTNYENYGGRGISVCERWFHFENFAEGMWPRNCEWLTIDRINNDDGYFLENCKWSNRTEQCLNRRLFKNNSTGATGVRFNKYFGFSATFNCEGSRYLIGKFPTFELAVAARLRFIKMFHENAELAVNTLPKDAVWRNSSTGVKGVSIHSDGGYIVRVTIDKIRHYVGYFKTIEEAKRARSSFIEESVRGIETKTEAC